MMPSIVQPTIPVPMIAKWPPYLIEKSRKTTRCVTAHEAVTRGGFGAELTAVIQHGAFDWLDAPIERVGAKFAPIPFAPVMEEFVVPHAKDVVEAIQQTVQRDGD